MKLLGNSVWSQYTGILWDHIYFYVYNDIPFKLTKLKLYISAEDLISQSEYPYNHNTCVCIIFIQ